MTVVPTSAQSLCGGSQCPELACFNEPKLFVLATAEHPDPVPAAIQSLCPPVPQAPCIVPPTPQIDTSFPTRSQEVTFKAEVPVGQICPVDATWYVEYKAGTTWTALYQWTSQDSVHHEFTDPDTGKIMAPFGASGLVEGAAGQPVEHRISVGYCCARPVGAPPPPSCTCLSDPLEFTTDVFRTDLPKVLQGKGLVTETEQSFDRTKTRPKRDGSGAVVGGDGTGPPEVWQDENPTPIGNGAFVDAGGFAVLPVSSVVTLTQPAENAHSVVEALVGLNTGMGNLNLDLQGRHHVAAGELRTYFFKLARGGLIGTGPRPDIILGASFCPADDPSTWPSGWECHGTWLEMGRISLNSNTDPTSAPGANAECIGFPDLAPATDERAWMALEVEDVDPDKTKLTAYLGWDHQDLTKSCAPGGDITACPRYCQITTTDTTDVGGKMHGIKGNWGFFAHEFGYKLFFVRGSSQPGS